jgi:hypothetical protein
MICSICLRYTDIDYTTPCQHKFHKQCIEGWFESLPTRAKTCPVCRFIIHEIPTIVIIEDNENPNSRTPCQQIKRCIRSSLSIYPLFMFMVSVINVIILKNNGVQINNMIGVLVIINLYMAFVFVLMKKCVEN